MWTIKKYRVRGKLNSLIDYVEQNAQINASGISASLKPIVNLIGRSRNPFYGAILNLNKEVTRTIIRGEESKFYTQSGLLTKLKEIKEKA